MRKKKDRRRIHVEFYKINGWVTNASKPWFIFEKISLCASLRSPQPLDCHRHIRTNKIWISWGISVKEIDLDLLAGSLLMLILQSTMLVTVNNVVFLHNQTILTLLFFQTGDGCKLRTTYQTYLAKKYFLPILLLNYRNKGDEKHCH